MLHRKSLRKRFEDMKAKENLIIKRLALAVLLVTLNGQEVLNRGFDQASERIAAVVVILTSNASQLLSRLTQGIVG